MAGSGVSLYATTAAGNKTVIGTIDWREDVYMPNQINDNVAQIMADIRAMANAVANGWIEIGDSDGTYTATYVSPTSFRFDGVDVTTYYRAGLRVAVMAPTPGTLVGTIVSSVFATHTTITMRWDTGALSNEAITAVQIGIGSGGGGGAQPSYRNALARNGGFEVWQRGAGGAALFQPASGYTCDGWNTSASMTVAVAQIAGLTSGSRWACRVQRVSGQPAGTISHEFPLDTDEIVPLRGSIVTLSMTLLAQASWAGGAINVYLMCGTGAPAKRSAGAYTGETQVISTTQTPTTTAARYTFTSSVIVPANTTQASVYLSWSPTGTAGAADAVDFDDVGLEVGAAASAFERRAFESELMACQRHYQKTFPYNIAPAAPGGMAGGLIFLQTVAAGVSQQAPSFTLPTRMRIAPSVASWNPISATNLWRNFVTSVDCSPTNFTSYENMITSTCTSTAGSAAGHPLGIHVTLDAGI